MAAKKKSAKRPIKKAAAKRPAKSAAKKSAKSTKRPAKKAPAKRVAPKKAPAKKSSSKRAVAKRSSAKVDATKIVIPPVPTRGSTTVTSTPAPSKPAAAPSAPAKKNSNGVLFLVIAGVVLLAIFALSNSSSNDDAAPQPTASESMSEEPTAEPSESSSEETNLTDYEAPMSFVAIRNSSGGVTLRWKAPSATEGLTGYAISVSYNAVDFTEVSTVGADQLNFDIALAGDEGGTQFLLQSVYSDGTKVDAKKFSLKGKYAN
ncbi:MAG: hypothetical protein ACKOFL_04740 [Actinomycetota bacterium]